MLHKRKIKYVPVARTSSLVSKKTLVGSGIKTNSMGAFLILFIFQAFCGRVSCGPPLFTCERVIDLIVFIEMIAIPVML